MNTQNFSNQLLSLEKDIANFQKKINDEQKKELNKTKAIDTINKSINKNTSPSVYSSKMRQIQTNQNDIFNIRKKILDYQKQITDKSFKAGKIRQDLQKAEANDRKVAAKEQESTINRFQTEIVRQREQINLLLMQSSSPNETGKGETEEKQYDFFISHASEDKNDIVRALAEALKSEGFVVWYDEFELKIGDSLRKKIDLGLSKSRYGIVIVSPSFVRKNWTEYELNGMVAREMNGQKIILPIWHKITKDEVLEFSPTLADKMALNTSIHSIKDIVEGLKEL